MTTNDALSPEERMLLLTQAGVSADDAQALVFDAAPEVINEDDEPVIPPTPLLDALMQPSVSEADLFGPVDIPAMLKNAQASELDKACKAIMGKAFADKAKAMSLCEQHGKAWFDERKFSKVQAAVAGVDRSAHNKALWAEAQKQVTTLKRMVRDAYRVTSVKAKIANSKAALPQQVRDMSDDALERLLASEAFATLLASQEQA